MHTLETQTVLSMPLPRSSLAQALALLSPLAFSFASCMSSIGHGPLRTARPPGRAGAHGKDVGCAAPALFIGKPDILKV